MRFGLHPVLEFFPREWPFTPIAIAKPERNIIGKPVASGQKKKLRISRMVKNMGWIKIRFEKMFPPFDKATRKTFVRNKIANRIGVYKLRVAKKSGFFSKDFTDSIPVSTNFSQKLIRVKQGRKGVMGSFTKNFHILVCRNILKELQERGLVLLTLRYPCSAHGKRHLEFTFGLLQKTSQKHSRRIITACRNTPKKRLVAYIVEHGLRETCAARCAKLLNAVWLMQLKIEAQIDQDKPR
jgi:hypothetical protein